MQNINTNYFLASALSRWAIGGFSLFVLIAFITSTLFFNVKNGPSKAEITLQKEVISSNAKPLEKTEKNHSRTTTKDEDNSNADDPYIINTEQAARLRTLLLPKPHGKHLLPPPLPTMASPIALPSASPPVTQRCNYNGQTYVPGDIVKSDQDWIRCTPTLFFTPNNLTRQNGSAVWTAVQ